MKEGKWKTNIKEHFKDKIPIAPPPSPTRKDNLIDINNLTSSRPNHYGKYYWDEEKEKSLEKFIKRVMIELEIERLEKEINKLKELLVKYLPKDIKS